MVILILSVSLFAQLEVKEGSFKEVPGFVNLNSDPNYQIDDNELPFAIIKVRTENINDKQRRELRFESNLAVGILLEYKTGEVWVYLTAKYADYLKISHPDFSSIEFSLPFDLQPKKGYELIIVNKANSIKDGWGSLIINTKPENDAKICLNGKVLNQKTPYTNEMIPAGRYVIIVSKENFHPITRTVDVVAGESKIVDIEMPRAYGSLIVESEPSGAQVFIDNKYYGVTPLNLHEVIVVGQHELRLEKENCSKLWKNITLEENNQISIKEKLKTVQDISYITEDNNLVFVVKGIAFEMIKVHGGSVALGKFEIAVDSSMNSIKLTDYYIGKVEVSQELWEAIMDNNPAYHKGINLPVERVTWDDCQIFIDKLNQLTGQKFRLPTEAEWEYAAKGGNKSNGYRFSGSKNINDVAIYYKDESDLETKPVGSKLPNELGIYDMSGNVSEWCHDTKSNKSSQRVNRGGCWCDGSTRCMVIYRKGNKQNHRDAYIGLRLAMD